MLATLYLTCENAPMERVPREWTVMTWNIQGRAKTDLDRIVEEIRRHEPDVVALQEIRKGQAEYLARHLSMRFAWALKHWMFYPFFKRWAEGAAILSPHVLDAAGHSVISDETSRRKWERRIVQFALVGRADSSAYRLYNVHLSPQEAAASRREEAVAVTEIVTEHGDAPPAIVLGDFNDDDDPYVIYTLPGIEHVTPPPTNPAAGPTKVIDHILLPSEASAVSVTVPAGGDRWDNVSDHLPVTSSFLLDWIVGDWPGAVEPG